MSTGDFDLEKINKLELHMLETYIKEQIQLNIIEQNSLLHSQWNQTAAGQQEKQKIRGLTAAELQQQYAQMNLIANTQYSVALHQQLMGAYGGLGQASTQAATTPPTLPYKAHDVGEYMLIREAGVWTLRHKPCMKRLDTSPWHSKTSNGTTHKFHVVDEDGVCSGCGGVADEAMLMQLDLRKLER